MVLSPYDKLVNATVAYFCLQGATDITVLRNLTASNSLHLDAHLKVRLGNILGLVTIATDKELSEMRTKTEQEWRNLLCTVNLMEGCLFIVVCPGNRPAADGLLRSIAGDASNACVLSLPV